MTKTTNDPAFDFAIAISTIARILDTDTPVALYRDDIDALHALSRQIERMYPS